MKMVKRKNSNNRGIQIIIAAAIIIIIGAAISKLAPTLKSWFSNNNINQLDNTVGASITEHYAPTIIKTDIDNNTCDLSIVVSREDLLRSIANMNQLGTSETVIQTFWLPSGKSFQFSTTKSDAEQALALMDAYLENHPGLTSPPIENILNGVEETTASEEIKDTEATEDVEEADDADETEETEGTDETEESETTKEAEESEESEASEPNGVESEAEDNTTLINLYARYNVRVDCQFPEGSQYEQYYAAFHDYDIAALHNYCQKNSLLDYTVNNVKSNGSTWDVTISNYVFNTVQTEIDTNPRHASTFTVPVTMERVTAQAEPTQAEPETKSESSPEPEDSSGEKLNIPVTTNPEETTPLETENGNPTIFSPFVIILIVIISVLICIVIWLIIKGYYDKKRAQFDNESYDYEDEHEEPKNESEYEDSEDENEDDTDEPKDPEEQSNCTDKTTAPNTRTITSKPASVDDFFANYVNANKNN